MNKVSFLICMLACTFVATSAFAQQNKVVVVPLGSSSVPGNLKTISVSSLGGIPEDTTTETNIASTCGYTGRYNSTGVTTNYLTIPIQLPNGATVTSFTVLFCDNSNGYRGVASLNRSDGTEMSYITTPSGVISTTPTEASDSTIASAVIDNSAYSYWVRMSMSPDSTNIYPISAYVTLK